MSTREAATIAKDKFKELYWKKSQDKFNLIAIGVDSIFTIDPMEVLGKLGSEDAELDDFDIIDEYFVRVYLFDINDVNNLELPNLIDDVEIRYIPVIRDI